MNKTRRRRHKPKEGVCGRCGHAVVRLQTPRAGWSHTSPSMVFDDYAGYGHLRVEKAATPGPRSRDKIIFDTERTLMGKSLVNLKLIKVRCATCAVS